MEGLGHMPGLSLCAKAKDMTIGLADDELAQAPWLCDRSTDDLHPAANILCMQRVELATDMDAELTTGTDLLRCSEGEVDVDGLPVTAIAGPHSAVRRRAPVKELDFEPE